MTKLEFEGTRCSRTFICECNQLNMQYDLHMWVHAHVIRYAKWPASVQNKSDPV